MAPSIILDFHSHLLPKMDDGASDLRETVALLRAASQAGVKTIVATPHFYPHRHDVSSFLLQRKEALASVTRECETSSLPHVLPGAEVLLCPGMERMEGIERLCAADTDFLLVELPFAVTERDEALFESLEALQSRKGLRVILAHPHRYGQKAVERACALGCRLQLNAADLRWPRGRKRAASWLTRGFVFFLGSDAHRDPSAYRHFSNSAKRSLLHTNEVCREQELFTGV